MTEFARRRVREAFGNGPVFLPVIHAEESALTLENTRIAFSMGANGIFLVSHTQDSWKLLEFYRKVRSEHPEVWIGLNFLRTHLVAACQLLPDDADGLWTDDNGIDESRRESTTPIGQFAIRWRIKENSDHQLWFGGFEFKYKPPAQDLRLAASIATKYMDVVTTSGDGTGTPPSNEKLHRIKSAIGGHPFANASGTSSDNVSQLLLGGVEIFLASTHLCRPGTDEFIPERLFELGGLIRTSGG